MTTICQIRVTLVFRSTYAGRIAAGILSPQNEFIDTWGEHHVFDWPLGERTSTIGLKLCFFVSFLVVFQNCEDKTQPPWRRCHAQEEIYITQIEQDFCHMRYSNARQATHIAEFTEDMVHDSWQPVHLVVSGHGGRCVSPCTALSNICYIRLLCIAARQQFLLAWTYPEWACASLYVRPWCRG